MKTNQKGFSVVEVLIIVVVVGLVGTVGWLVYDRQKSNKTDTRSPTTNTNQQQGEPKEEAQQPVSDETANWRVITSGQGKFTFKAPDGWKFVNCTDADWVYVRYEGDANDTSLEYQQSKPVNEVKQQCGGFGDIIKFSIERFNADGSSSRGVRAPDPIVGGTAITTGSGIKGQKKCDETRSKPFNNAPAIIKNCQYSFATNNSQVWLNYQLLEGNKDRTDLIEDVVKTIKFD